MVIFFTTIVSSILLIGNISGIVMGQSNDTAQGNNTDYSEFHTNIEIIKGHIEKAMYNKFFDNQSLTLGHTQHPIEEVLSLLTLPLTQVNSNLNQSYFENLYKLSTMASNNSTLEDFDKQGNASIQLSNDVISAVIPKQILDSAGHNISVIQDLLTTSGSEYTEGVANGSIISVLEFQDGTSFMHRAYDLFNNTENISNDTNKITQILAGFENLTDAANNLKDPSVIKQIIVKINTDLGGDNQINGISTESKELTSDDYIAKIRGLLNQVISAYESNDKVKAKELATTAYLDNFEFLEAPIGKTLADKGESLMREKLRDQIDTNASLDEIKQNIADINSLLDESQTALSSSSK